MALIACLYFIFGEESQLSEQELEYVPPVGVPNHVQLVNYHDGHALSQRVSSNQVVQQDVGLYSKGSVKEKRTGAQTFSIVQTAMEKSSSTELRLPW